MTGRRLGLTPVALLALSACAATGVHTRAGGAVSPLVVRAVDWNTTHVSVGHVRAVADSGQTVAVFSDEGASVLSAGALVARDARTKDWISAGVIPGADGTARWIVGIDAGGHVHYLHNLLTFDDVSARYGLVHDRVRSITTAKHGDAAFLLDNQVAVATPRDVTRYPTSKLDELVAGAEGVVVGVTTDAIQVLHLEKVSLTSSIEQRTVTGYSLPGVTHAAVGIDGRIYACTKRALYATDREGLLSLLYVANHDDLHGLVASGDHIWFIDGRDLGLAREGRVEETASGLVPLGATLAPSMSGDVWVIAGGTLARYQATPTTTNVGATASWTTSVAPVFARACAALMS
jgi:hypothetical protein